MIRSICTSFHSHISTLHSMASRFVFIGARRLSPARDISPPLNTTTDENKNMQTDSISSRYRSTTSSHKSNHSLNPNTSRFLIPFLTFITFGFDVVRKLLPLRLHYYYHFHLTHYNSLSLSKHHLPTSHTHTHTRYHNQNIIPPVFRLCSFSPLGFSTTTILHTHRRKFITVA